MRKEKSGGSKTVERLTIVALAMLIVFLLLAIPLALVPYIQEFEKDREQGEVKESESELRTFQQAINNVIYGLRGEVLEDVQDTRAYYRDHADEIEENLETEGFDVTFPKKLGEQKPAKVSEEQDVAPATEQTDGVKVDNQTLYEASSDPTIRSWEERRNDILLNYPSPTDQLSLARMEADSLTPDNQMRDAFYEEIVDLHESGRLYTIQTDEEFVDVAFKASYVEFTGYGLNPKDNSIVIGKVVNGLMNLLYEYGEDPSSPDVLEYKTKIDNFIKGGSR